jgi:exosortase H (IPTLxxWG-CTERM-specific)
MLTSVATRRASVDADAEKQAKSRRGPQLRFVLTFVAAAAVLFSLYSFPYAENGISETWFQGYLRAYARLAGSILSIFDGQVDVAGTVIGGRYWLRIVKTCDAMEANLLFLAAVFAFPARWSRKAVAALLGIVVLVGVNVIRICSLYFIGLYLPARFELFHAELWPLLLIVFSLGKTAGSGVSFRSARALGDRDRVSRARGRAGHDVRGSCADLVAPRLVGRPGLPARRRSSAGDDLAS